MNGVIDFFKKPSMTNLRVRRGDKGTNMTAAISGSLF